MEQDDQADKSHDASPQKLLKAREKGDIARSTDLTTVAAYAGAWLALSAFGWAWVSQVGTAMSALLANADSLADLVFSARGVDSIAALSGSVMPAMLGFFGLAAGAVLLVLFAQRGIVFAPTKLEPKLSRISPISNAKQKFGRTGLFEFAKSFVKLCLLALCLSLFLHANIPDIVQSSKLEPALAMGVLGQMMLRMLALIVAVAGIIAALDVMWQRADHLRRNRMSHKELTDEHKEAEGDPALKAKRRQKAQDIAMNRMLADVPKADVVIVNPTHYAVALDWDRTPNSAPKCVAKGTDEIALRIRDIARTSGVPIQEDPPTARALHATMKVGEQIPYEHFAAVAVAIRFAERMRDRQRRGA